MASKIKGITIEIDGSTKGLDKALSDVNSKSRDLQSELNQVQRALKFEPGNTTLLAQQQQLLSEQVETTTKKLNQLKDAQSQVTKQFESGKIGADQLRAFEREVVQTESKLNNLKDSLAKVGDSKGLNNAKDDLNKLSKYADDSKSSVKGLGSTISGLGSDASKLDRLKNGFKEVGKSAKDAGKEISSSLGTAGAVGVAAVGGLVTGMQEYNQDLARLRTNASMSGHDLGLVEQAFKDIATVTGETDSAVETVSNLLATGFNDNQLAGMIEQINGAAIKFSDTLKTEGIADGIQETFATGKATGQFGELLERSGVNLDTFNAKLQEAQKQGQGTQFVMQTMADLGFGAVTEKYKEMNPEVQKNAEAQVQLQTSLAALASVLTPLVTSITQIVTAFVQWATQNPVLVTTIVALGGAIAIIVGVCSALVPVFSALSIVAGAFNISMLPLTGIILAVIAVITALIAAGVWLYQNWDWLSIMAGQVWAKIKEGISNFINGAIDLFNQIISFVRNNWAQLLLLLVNPFAGAFALLYNNCDSFRNFINGFAAGIANAFTSLPGKMIEIGRNIVAGLRNGISNAWSGLMSWLSEKVNAITNKVKSVLQIHSPSRVMEKLGEFTGEGFVIGMNNTIGQITKASEAMANAVNPVANINGSSGSSNGGIAGNTVLYAQNPIYLDGKIIANATTPLVVSNITRNQTSRNISKGRL